MAKAKEGKVDAGYFKNMVHKREETEKVWGPSEFMKKNLNLIILADGS